MGSGSVTGSLKAEGVDTVSLRESGIVSGEDVGTDSVVLDGSVREERSSLDAVVGTAGAVDITVARVESESGFFR